MYYIEKAWRGTFGIVFWVHVAFVVAALSSPFWLHWKWIALSYFFYIVFYVYFGGCALNQLQFGSHKRSFCSELSKNLGLDYTRRQCDNFTMYMLPGLVLVFTVAHALV